MPAINIANAVTVGRVILALFVLNLLWFSSDTMRWIAFALTALVIYADALDGYLARKLNQSTKLGAVLDIAGDRFVELAYWIVFTALDWIPAWVPILFLLRGIYVDAIRAKASELGYTAFGANTMMKSGLGKFLVASNFSRFSYAVAKALAFCLLIAAHTTTFANTALPAVAMFCVYFASAFCLIRGLPVILEGRHLLK